MAHERSFSELPDEPSKPYVLIEEGEWSRNRQRKEEEIGKISKIGGAAQKEDNLTRRWPRNINEINKSIVEGEQSQEEEDNWG